MFLLVQLTCVHRIEIFIKFSALNCLTSRMRACVLDMNSPDSNRGRHIRIPRIFDGSRSGPARTMVAAAVSGYENDMLEMLCDFARGG